MLCSQLSKVSGVGRDLLSPSFVPEGKFDTVPEPELVIDDSQIVFDDVFCCPDGVRDFAVFKPLGDELDDLLFALTGYSVSVTLFSEHNCLR
jgi:hypothetical protein